MDASVKTPQRRLSLTPDEHDMLDRLRTAGRDGRDAAGLIEWLETEAVALYHANNRLYSRIASLETKLAINIAAYPERFYAEMNVDNWHLLMRAAGIKAKKTAPPEAMRANLDGLAHAERVAAFENYICGSDHEGRPMLSNAVLCGNGSEVGAGDTAVKS